MSNDTDNEHSPFRVQSIAELWGCALIIEEEAVSNYEMLATQMEMHNNRDVAAFFREMAEIEQLHVKHILKMTEDIQLPRLDPTTIQWPDNQTPESLHHEDMHYLLTPHQAIALAVAAEKRALMFYQQIVISNASSTVREWASELATEEEEHVELLLQWQQKYPPPDADWDEDPDPVVNQG